MPDSPTPADALRALTDRGINGAHDLVELGTPDQILSACHRWDRERNVRPGLLVHRIRAGDFAGPDEPQPKTSKSEMLRARFDDYARRHPVGSSPMSHPQIDARLRPDNIDECPGRMIVQDSTSYPVLVLECDTCGFEQGIPVRGLHLLGKALAAAPDPEPEPEPAADPF